MARIATSGLQQNALDSIVRAQSRLAGLQEQLASGKKAKTFSDLGTDTVKTLSARNALDRLEAYRSSNKQLENTLNLYEFKYEQLSDLANNLKTQLSGAAGQSTGTVQQEIVQAFNQFRTILLSEDAGFPMFLPPKGEGVAFRLNQFSDAVQTDDQAFGPSAGKNRAIISEGVSIGYGNDARSIGSSLLAAFRELASQPPLSGTITPGQRTAIDNAINLIRQAETDVAAATGENGNNLRRLSDLETSASRRANTLNEAISKFEDSNLPELASKISQQKTLLETSYAAFSQLSNLSLINFLR